MAIPRRSTQRPKGRGWVLTAVIAMVLVGVLAWWVYNKINHLAGGGSKDPNAIDESEPRMAAATAEAKRRWPEFVDLYRHKDFNQKFFVKAKFAEGHTAEWLWVQVNLLDGITGRNADTISGTIDTPPQRLGTVLPGSAVTSKLENVGDWLVVRGDEHIGGFTIPVMEQIEKERGIRPAPAPAPAKPGPATRPAVPPAITPATVPAAGPATQPAATRPSTAPAA